MSLTFMASHAVTYAVCVVVSTLYALHDVVESITDEFVVRLLKINCR